MKKATIYCDIKKFMATEYEKGYSEGFEQGKRITMEAMQEIIDERMEVLQGIVDRSISPILRQDAQITKHALEVIRDELVIRLKGGDKE